MNLVEYVYKNVGEKLGMERLMSLTVLIKLSFCVLYVPQKPPSLPRPQDILPKQMEENMINMQSIYNIL